MTTPYPEAPYLKRHDDGTHYMPCQEVVDYLTINGVRWFVPYQEVSQLNQPTNTGRKQYRKVVGLTMPPVGVRIENEEMLEYANPVFWAQHDTTTRFIGTVNDLQRYLLTTVPPGLPEIVKTCVATCAPMVITTDVATYLPYATPQFIGTMSAEQNPPTNRSGGGYGNE